MPRQYIATIEEYLGLVDILQEQKFSILLNLVRTNLTQQLLDGFFSSQVSQYFQQQNAIGEPYVNFAQDPKPIIQVKEFINALWQGEQALEYMENVPLRGELYNHCVNLVSYLYQSGHLLKFWDFTAQEIENLPQEQVFLHMWLKTSHQVYQAFWKITHSEIESDLYKIFFKELQNFIFPAFLKFDEAVRLITKTKDDFLNLITPIEWSHQSGLITGIVVDQMNPHAGKLDMEFLVKLANYLPSYLHKFSNYITKFKQQVSERQPTIDKQKLELFENNALDLLASLDHIQKGGSIFSCIHYIRIINHTTILIRKICSEIGKANKDTQDWIKQNLKELKYYYLPELFASLDKVEITCMLKPGTITYPVQLVVDHFYNSLISLCSKIVDFNQNDLLLVPFDAKFMYIRVQPIYQKTAQYYRLSFKIMEEKQNAINFFTLVKNIAITGKRFIDLEQNTKKTLINHLKILQPYFIRLNLPLYKAMVDSLTAGWVGYASNAMHYWTGYKSDKNLVNDILYLEEQFYSIFTSDTNTYSFYSNLYESLIENVYVTHKLRLNKFGIKNFESNFSILETDEEQNVFNEVSQALLMNYLALNIAEKFSAKIISLLHEPSLDKNILANLYAQIQSNLHNLELDESRLRRFDRTIMGFLSSESEIEIQISEIIEIFEEIKNAFSVQKQNISDETHYCLNNFNQLQIQDVIEHDLVLPEEIKRAHFVFKSTKCSQYLQNMRIQLNDLTRIFNNYIQRELRIANSTTLPFPEVRLSDGAYKCLAQPKQLLAIKYTHNLLFSITEIARRLEQLRDDDYESFYVTHVIRSFAYIKRSMAYLLSIYSDPYIETFFSEIKENLQDAYDVLTGVMQPYKPQNANHNIAIVFALNALSILPNHIKALQSNTTVEPRWVNKQHKRSEIIVKRIKAIIDASGSYFKLFLNASNMYCLWRELRSKVLKLGYVINETVLSELETIRDDILGKMLKVADDYEEKLGLRPGFLSTPIQHITDEYFEGLLEPLGLDSKMHVDLIRSSKVLEDRISENNKRIENAESNIQALNIKKNIIEDFQAAILRYQSLYVSAQNAVYGSSQDSTLQQSWIEVQSWYNEILNLLNENNARDLNDFYYAHFNIDVNQLLFETDYIKKLSQLKKLGKFYLDHTKGLLNTERLTKNNLVNIKVYLDDLLYKEPERVDAFLIKYSRKIIKEQTKSYLDSWLNLVTCNEEYQLHLTQFLEERENALVSQVKSQENIIQSVNNALREEINKFHENHDYFKLEAIRSVLNKMETYLFSCGINNQTVKHSFFEDAKTLDKKSRQIMLLKNFVYDESKSVTERIKLLSDYIEIHEESLSKTMLDSRKVYGISCDAIKRYFVALLELLGFYTPEYKKHYYELLTVTQAPAKPKCVGQEFSFFMNQRGYELPGANSFLQAFEDDLDTLESPGLS